MEIKRYLAQVFELEKSIELQKDEIREMRMLSESPASPKIGVRVTTSLDPDRIGKIISLIDLKTNACSQTIVELLMLKATIQIAIDKLENKDQQDILRLRYVHLKPWESIFQELNYANPRRGYKIHSQGVENIGKYLNSTFV